MHKKKKKEHKKRGIGWTMLRIFLGAAGILVLVLVVYIGYLFASYHRIEDNWSWSWRWKNRQRGMWMKH